MEYVRITKKQGGGRTEEGTADVLKNTMRSANAEEWKFRKLEARWATEISQEVTGQITDSLGAWSVSYMDL